MNAMQITTASSRLLQFASAACVYNNIDISRTPLISRPNMREQAKVSILHD